uniref:PDZ domain-containing protein n=1 Tax=Eutreptiella gymnastica TaxID=73025 RepID=A0A7S4CYE1_9EUGL
MGVSQTIAAWHVVQSQPSRSTHILRAQRTSPFRTPTLAKPPILKAHEQERTENLPDLSAAKPMGDIPNAPKTSDGLQLPSTERPVPEFRAELLGKATTLGIVVPGIGRAFDLSGPSSVLVAILVVAGIIIVHELGHFAAARLQKIRVSQFAVGLGPKIWEYQGPQVKYTLSALLTGGFVAFPDDDPHSDIPKDDPDLLKNRPVRDRAVVVCAGVVANMILAWTILFAQTTLNGIEKVEYMDGIKIRDVVPQSASYVAGLKEGDIVLSFNGEAIGKSSGDKVRWFQSQIRSSPGLDIDLTIDRNGQRMPIHVIPSTSATTGNGIIGTNLETNYKIAMEKVDGLPRAITHTSKTLYKLTKGVATSFLSVFQGKQETSLSGPVKIISVGAEFAREDPSNGLYRFAAALNVNLAVINLLPLPGLDGGAFALLMVEAIRGGKRLPGNTERLIQGTGFLLFAGVGVAIIFKDFAELLVH